MGAVNNKPFDYVTIVGIKTLSANTKVKENKFKNKKIKYQTDIKFFYTKREIYNSRLIIYNDAELDEAITFDSTCIPSRIKYGKLIADPAKRRYVFLSTEMEPLYKIYVVNNKSRANLNYSELLLMSDDNDNDHSRKEIKDIYGIIKNNYQKQRSKICRGELIRYLPTDIVNNIILF